MQNRITIKVGTAEFKATLTDNATAKAFRQRLPMTVKMQEHAGNEKFYTLPGDIPANAFQPGNIYKGDLMLWGNNTIVLFYKSFTSAYSYTRIGKVDNPEGLDAAVGGGDVEVTFSLQTTDR